MVLSMSGRLCNCCNVGLLYVKSALWRGILTLELLFSCHCLHLIDDGQCFNAGIACQLHRRNFSVSCLAPKNSQHFVFLTIDRTSSTAGGRLVRLCVVLLIRSSTNFCDGGAGLHE
jgi:hypothetical protein